MDLHEVLMELESYADERTKNTHMKHGAKEPLFGVKVSDLKNTLKRLKTKTGSVKNEKKQGVKPSSFG